MVIMTFVADIKVLNLLTLGVPGGRYSMYCFFSGHNDESRMPKIRQPWVNGYAANQNLSSWTKGRNG
ncbi:hypothetical protein TNCV_1530881 [Trichonephila clavipes]|nr:hypothetical protein TNCV_1530881 [Trichonephila clavipes]